MTLRTDITRPRIPIRVLNHWDIGSSPHTEDMIVAGTLLALLIAAFATNAGASGQIGNAGFIHQSHVAFVIEAVATLGVSIGLVWLLFLSWPCSDDKGAMS